MTELHADQPVRRAGPTLEEAGAVAVLLHGRGARAESVLALAGELAVDEVAVLAPQAANNTWYPNSFMAPIDSNEPWLSSALETVGDTIGVARDAGFSRADVLVGGFSQGACLASEYVARNPDRYGGVVTLSGGLIGPEGTDFDYEGSLDGTPVFLGCSDRDPHIPIERVHETADVFEAMDAQVDERIYEGMGHTINADERDAVAGLLQSLTEA